MALVPVSTRNRVSPLPVATVEQSMVPYVTDEQGELCTDPNCSVCRGQRTGRHHKHHHHKRHHHKKYHTSSWNEFFPREESGTSILSSRSIVVSDGRSQVTERALVPINQTERQVVTTTQTKRLPEEEIVRDAWTTNRSADDEIVCCRAYDGCRCPCWCCIIMIVLLVILIIVLIVLLATLL